MGAIADNLALECAGVAISDARRGPPGRRGAMIAGPRQLPLIGNLLEFRKAPLDFLMNTTLEFGDVVPLRFGPEGGFLISHPDHVQHLFQDNYRNYGKQTQLWEKLKPLLGDGLITAEGDEWVRQRRLAQPAFRRKRMPDFAAVMIRNASRAFAEIDRHAAAQRSMNVVPEMMRLTLRILGDTLFGADLEAAAQELHEVINVMLLRITEQTRSVEFLLPSWVPTPGNLSFRRALRRYDDVVTRLMAGARRAPDDVPSLVKMMLSESDDETGARMDEGLVREQVKSFLFAGHETTATTLSWALYSLAKFPAIAARARAEVDSILGDRVPRSEDVPRLEFVGRFLQETMRLYPPVWFLGRSAIERDRIGDAEIRPGCVVMPSPYVTHRRPDIWERPRVFDPDRFLPEAVEKRPRFAYIPFGAGPRVCIGKHFATMEMTLVVAMVLQRFEITRTTTEEAVVDPSITLRPAGKLELLFSRR